MLQRLGQLEAGHTALIRAFETLQCLKDKPRTPNLATHVFSSLVASLVNQVWPCVCVLVCSAHGALSLGRCAWSGKAVSRCVHDEDHGGEQYTVFPAGNTKHLHVTTGLCTPTLQQSFGGDWEPLVTVL